MKNIIKTNYLIVIILLTLSNVCYAALSISVNGDSPVTFGTMDPGSWTELYPEGRLPYAYCNEVVVKSTVNSEWNLYVNLSGELTKTASTATIPNSSFMWMAAWAGPKDPDYSRDLRAGLAPIAYKAFSLVNDLVYTSGKASVLDDDITTISGTGIQVKYGLSMPTGQTAGDYSTTIQYTVTQ